MPQRAGTSALSNQPGHIVKLRTPAAAIHVSADERDGKEEDLEGVDGTVVRGRELLAVGERERGGAPRSGEGLEAPRAQLPAFPSSQLLQPHPLGHGAACMLSAAANGAGSRGGKGRDGLGGAARRESGG